MKLGLAVVLFSVGARGHAVLRDPTPRQGEDWATDDAGPKLSPFSDATEVANRLEQKNLIGSWC